MASITARRSSSYLRDAFDVLYAEGMQRPKMMSVGLHCRLVGRPGRAAALIRFLDYARSHERVWITTRARSPATGIGTIRRRDSPEPGRAGLRHQRGGSEAAVGRGAIVSTSWSRSTPEYSNSK